MNEKRLFFDFLQKHNALKAYKINFKQHTRRNLKPNEYIPLILSFSWRNSSKGFLYWSELDQKWRNYQNYKIRHF